MFHHIIKSFSRHFESAWLKLNILLRARRCANKLRDLQADKTRPIRVAFLHMYATSTQTLSIFKLMLADGNFAPYFIVNPDIFRSKENAISNYERSKKELIAQFGVERVLEAYDAKGNFIDYTRQFDLCTTNNPYDNLAAPLFQIAYWTRRGVPMFYSSYFYMGRCVVSIGNLRQDTSNYFWRFYVDNQPTKELAVKHQKIKGRNCVVTGSPKTDDYANVSPHPHSRKCILIAPHHAIEEVAPQTGAFMEYAEQLPKLVKRFPQIDFLFRPHALLFEHLRNKYWGTEKTEAYLSTLKSLPNFFFSNEANYWQEFADSEALIHDCGSFSAEYLFTGKPCAYIWRSSVTEPHRFYTDLGLACINSHYVCHAHEEVVNFIEKVVLAGEDPKKEARQAFAKANLMFNYPHASEAIVADIKKSMGRE